MLRCSVSVQMETTHSNRQLGGDMTRASARVLRVEVGRWAAHEAGLQHIPTSTIGEEAALVQVHLLPGGLKVQSHCGTPEKSAVSPETWFQHACQRKTFQPERTGEITVRESGKRQMCRDTTAVCRNVCHQSIIHLIVFYKWIQWNCCGENLILASKLEFDINPSGSRRSTFPEDHSWMIGGAGQRGRSGSAACCCVSQKASLQMKRQKKARVRTHWRLILFPQLQ